MDRALLRQIVQKNIIRTLPPWQIRIRHCTGYIQKKVLITYIFFIIFFFLLKYEYICKVSIKYQY